MDVKEEVVDTVKEVMAEFVDIADLHVISTMQKDYELAKLNLDLMAHKLELVKLRLARKYNMGDNDFIQDGQIKRK